MLRGWRTPQHRDGMALVLSSALSSGVGLLYWVVAARLFDPATVGLNSTALSTMTFLGSAAQLNLGNAMLRFVPVVGRQTRAFVLGCYAVAVGIAACVGAVFAAGAGLWAPDLLHAAGHPLLFLFFVVCTPLWTMFVLQEFVLTAIKRSTVVPLENLAFALLKIALLVAAAWLALRAGIAVSWVAATVLIVIGVTAYLVRVMPSAMPVDLVGVEVTQPIRPRVTLRDVARFVRSDYAGNVCWQAATFGLPLLVLALADPEGAATYGVVWQIAFGLYLVANGMGRSLVAHVAADPKALDGALRSMVQKALTLTVPAIVVIAPGSHLLLSLFGSSYADAGALLLSLLALSAVPNVITQAAVWGARVRRQGTVLFVVPASIAAIVIAGTVVLVPRYGITGAGVAWLAGQSVVAAVILLQRRRSRARWRAAPELLDQT